MMAVSLQAMSFSYGATAVLNALTATFPSQGVLAFRAPSGAGKTTLLRILAGLARPTEGEAIGLPLRPSVLFQENRLLAWETARQNVQLVCHDAAQAEAWLETVGLAGEADRFPPSLSGGMNRRLALARALAFDGDALILDEPFNGVDRERVARLAQPILQYAQTRPVFLVTHSEEELRLLHAQVWDLEGLPVTACRRAEWSEK